MRRAIIGFEPRRNRKPEMVRIGREIAYHYGLCGLCDDQLRRLGDPNAVFDALLSPLPAALAVS
jgi:hypothetical protein